MILKQLVVRHNLLLVKRSLLLFSAIPSLHRQLLLQYGRVRSEEPVEHSCMLLYLDEFFEVPRELTGDIVIVRNVFGVDKLPVEHGLQHKLVEDQRVAADVDVVVGSIAKVQPLVPSTSDGSRFVKLLVRHSVTLAVARLHYDFLSAWLQVNVLDVSLSAPQKHMVLHMKHVRGKA